MRVPIPILGGLFTRCRKLVTASQTRSEEDRVEISKPGVFPFVISHVESNQVKLDQGSNWKTKNVEKRSKSKKHPPEPTDTIDTSDISVAANSYARLRRRWASTLSTSRARRQASTNSTTSRIRKPKIRVSVIAASPAASVSNASTSESSDESAEATCSPKLRRQDRKNLDILHDTAHSSRNERRLSHAEVINKFLNTITNDIVDNKEPVPKDPLQPSALGAAGMYPTKQWLTDLKRRGIKPTANVHHKDVRGARFSKGRKEMGLEPLWNRHVKVMRAASSDLTRYSRSRGRYSPLNRGTGQSKGRYKNYKYPQSSQKKDYSQSSQNKNDYPQSTQNKCEYPQSTQKKCEYSQSTQNKCDYSQSAQNKCDYSQNTQKKCDYSQNTQNKCDYPQSTQKKCDNPQSTQKKCRRKSNYHRSRSLNSYRSRSRGAYRREKS